MKVLSLAMLLAVSLHTNALEALSDQELAATTGGTIEPEIAYLDTLNNAVARAEENQQLNEQENLNAVFAVTGLFFLPFSEAVTADREVVGVDYGDREPIQTDGGISLQLPVLIERVSYHNIRPVAGENNPSMGSIHLEGVRFSDDAYIVVHRR